MKHETGAEALTNQQLIERWQNVERVLVNLPKHERTKHWHMSTFGRTTACGTAACAAGHCGMDNCYGDSSFHAVHSSFIGEARNLIAKATQSQQNSGSCNHSEPNTGTTDAFPSAKRGFSK